MITVTGVPQTQAALARVQAQVQGVTPTAVQQGAEAVGRQMVALAPRLTGALVASISVDTSEGDDESTAAVGAAVPYDRYVQRGTRYMAAQPYGQQAAAAAAPAVVATMAGVYKVAAR